MMPNSAATATSAEEYLSCWRGPLEQRLRTAVGKALAEQPKDPCAAVALNLLRGTSLEERAAALSAAQAEQEDGPQDDFAGPFQRRCLCHPPHRLWRRPMRSVTHAPLPPASAAPPIPPPSLARDPATVRFPMPTHGRTLPGGAGDAQVGCTASKTNETELRKLRDEIQSLKDQLHNVGTPSATATSRDGKADACPHLRPRHRQRQRPPPPLPRPSPPLPSLTATPPSPPPYPLPLSTPLRSMRSPPRSGASPAGWTPSP